MLSPSLNVSYHYSSLWGARTGLPWSHGLGAKVRWPSVMAMHPEKGGEGIFRFLWDINHHQVFPELWLHAEHCARPRRAPERRKQSPCWLLASVTIRKRCHTAPLCYMAGLGTEVPFIWGGGTPGRCALETDKATFRFRDQFLISLYVSESSVGPAGLWCVVTLVSHNPNHWGTVEDNLLFCLGMSYMEGPLFCYREEAYHIG